MLRFGASRNILLRRLSFRKFGTSLRLFDANAFAMPAMSPTMEKGGIVQWKFKVGEPFSAGDVLLEVETDKAQIDVEAQDDGKIAKIIIGDGAKDVPVGDTIAFLAEVDDDLSTLKIPDVTAAPKKDAAPKTEPLSKPISKPVENPTEVRSNETVSSAATKSADMKQVLLPSVAIELSLNGIKKEDALKNIKATGTKGRLLKGDVLAYVGKINKDSPSKIASYIEKGEKLDLSNIELREPAVQETKESTSKESTKMVKEPIILNEYIALRAKPGASLEKLELALGQYLDSMFQKAHNDTLVDTRSQFYDPIFEDLLSIESNKPRFTLSYELIELENEDIPSRRSRASEADIFDLLSNETPASQVNEKSNNNATEFVVSLRVEVNDKYPDSMERAQKFVSYMKQLQL
ncbi:hypothetical protein Kpol_1060p38 [Vanderwaltozyma polyspora DSM 70294]|uniref:Uncharacterized protein n=1 Tax=Vanderwaltozyma polyspora (strain ATCC 22028 / DSM 70294 / BCRC 21397 / CBS 2163 / NBRC 10782 / NRRL Y-8283 / UCD 57-17) TaxID=436907 RepID=A7TK36_VANPO|nr:uncharacterized protein Kpol_1060p38 [Vanderwaltozyma polyspora DSM 70294]EDO17382.1 hypothetical protein Kpol_1060p38 [Vanderwaltozyma polyspora DSM 70294]